MKLHPCFEAKEAWFKDWFDSYHEFYTHLDWYDELMSCFGYAELRSLGQTSEARRITVIKLRDNVNRSRNILKPALYFQVSLWRVSLVTTHQLQLRSRLPGRG